MPAYKSLGMAGESNPLKPPKGVPAKPLDELFAGPLEEFTSGRNELAKQLPAGLTADRLGDHADRILRFDEAERHLRAP